MKLHLIIALYLICSLTKSQLSFSQGFPDKTSGPCTIEIYLVKKISHIDSTVQTSNSPNFRCRYCFIPSVEDIADTAFIKDSEITGYGLRVDSRRGDSAHYLFLSEAALSRLHKLTDKVGEFPGRCAFAMVVNGKPVYGGWFLSRFVSNFHGADWIYVFTPFDEDKQGGLRIDLHPIRMRSHPFNLDPRSDTSLIDCLKRTGRYIIK
jgi:hypothetical protein